MSEKQDDLQRELATQTARADDMYARYYAENRERVRLETEIWRQEAALAGLVEALRQLEWVGQDDGKWHSCPACGGIKEPLRTPDVVLIPAGHEDDCFLVAVLAATAGPPSAVPNQVSSGESPPLVFPPEYYDPPAGTPSAPG